MAMPLIADKPAILRMSLAFIVRPDGRNFRLGQPRKPSARIFDSGSAMQSLASNFLALSTGLNIACYAEPCILAVVELSVCMSACLSVWCPSHAGIVSKRCNLVSQNLQWPIPQGSSFGDVLHPKIRKDSPWARALSKGKVWKIGVFRPVSRQISETVQDRIAVDQ